MSKEKAKKQALALVNQENLVMTLGTIGTDGAPEIKAMVKIRNDGLHRFWFCSNTSARRTEILRNNNCASLYAFEYKPDADPIVCRGVMLSGTAELSWDDDLRRSFWQDWMKMYYPKGALDPDFVVVQFTAERGNYYEGLQNTDFTI